MFKTEKKKLNKFLSLFCPTYLTDHVTDVTLDFLTTNKKSVLLLDVDSTIAGWNDSLPVKEIQDWILNLSKNGILVYLVSNTHRAGRLQNIASELGIRYVRGLIKPFTYMHDQVLCQTGKNRDDCIMIGDQLLTDILSSNRFGIDSIWVKPLPAGEFIGTKCSRVIESFLVKIFKNNQVY